MTDETRNPTHEAEPPDELLTGMSVAHAIAIARMNWGKARGPAKYR